MASSSNTTNLMVRLDEESKAFIAKAAERRCISMSDYVRMVLVSQARREVEEAEHNLIALTPDEQLEFWNALAQSTELTDAQRQLGTIMRGES